MPNLDNDLQEMLRSAAERISIPPSPVGLVMAKGQTRHHRQRTISILAVVMVVAATAVVTLSNRGSHATTVASNGTTGVSAALEWKAVNTAATLGYDTTLTPGGASALYAVSTAPGVSTNVNQTPTLYRSVDGINWTPIAGPAGLSLDSLSAVGDHVYEVGTGTATAAVATSTDGSTWQQSPLNLDLASVLTKATSNGTENVNVTAGAAGVLATVTVNATLDLAKVLPAGAPTPSSWVATADGVELLTGTCPSTPAQAYAGSGKATAADRAYEATGDASSAKAASGSTAARQAYRVTGESPQAEPTGAPVLCYSPAGTEPGPGPYRDVVSAAALGPVAASYTWAQLGVSGDTERAVLDEPFGFLSTDGTTFHPVTLPGSPGGGEPQIVAGPTGFGLVEADQAIGVNAERDAFYQSTDGANWVPAPPLPDPVDTYSVQVGSLDGHFAIVDEGTPSHLETLVGDHWAVTDLGQVAGSPAGQGSVDQAAFGPLGVAMVLMNNAESGQTDGAVLYSPDGVTWSSSSLAAIAGGPVGDPNVISMTASQVVVVAPSGTPTNPPSSLTLVGTPAASS